MVKFKNFGANTWSAHGNSEHSIYDSDDITLTSKQLCAGLPATNNSIAAYNGQHEEDYGGPLICFQNKQPILREA